MKFFTKNSDYAVRALLYLAKQNKRFVSSSEVAKKENISLYFLRKILQVLIKEKIIASKEGAQGGLQLQKKPSQMKVLDIMRLFQGNVTLLDCALKNKLCSNVKRCVLRKKMKAIEGKVIAELSSMCISDLLKERSSQ